MTGRRLLVFGATGRTGSRLVDLAHGAGWSVTAAVRDPTRTHLVAAGSAIAVADALSRPQVEAALDEARPDVVVSALGGRGDTMVDDLGVGNLADACATAGIRRLIVVTSLGCGGSRAHASPRLLEAIGEVLAAKTRGEDALVASDLDWTIVRPGGLGDETATGRAVLVEDETVHGRIACADLARLLLDLVDDPSSIRRILSAVDPSLPIVPRTTPSPAPAPTRGDLP